MKTVSRRDLLKSSIMVPAGIAAAQGLGPMGSAAQTTAQNSEPLPISAASEASIPGAGRERLLLDFDWRFHLGNADDPSKDFDFGSGRTGNFQKTGNFLPAGALAYDDSDWQPVNLPHDWAVELPFQNDPALASKGYYPLGRTYPSTSVGWYRRVFDLPAADAGKRLTLEFDGSYRETMVVLNGFFIGNHSGGYDPFSFDVTDFANPGGRNVLLVRVDATLSDGWFYEGAGIYRHVWLVKTDPLHVKQWGTFVSAEVESGKATLSIRTEVTNQGKTAQSARVISTVLDPSGKAVEKVCHRSRLHRQWRRPHLRTEICGEKPAALVARREKPLQASDRGPRWRRGRGSLRDALWNPHASSSTRRRASSSTASPSR